MVTEPSTFYAALPFVHYKIKVNGEIFLSNNANYVLVTFSVVLLDFIFGLKIAATMLATFITIRWDFHYPVFWRNIQPFFSNFGVL